MKTPCTTSSTGHKSHSPDHSHLPIGAALHLRLRAGQDMPAALGIEAYLVRVLVGHLDELLIKGRDGGTIAVNTVITVISIVVTTGRLSTRFGAGIRSGLDLVPQIQRRH